MCLSLSLGSKSRSGQGQRKLGKKSVVGRKPSLKSPNFKVHKSRQTMHVLDSVLPQESDASVILGLRGHLRS